MGDVGQQCVECCCCSEAVIGQQSGRAPHTHLRGGGCLCTLGDSLPSDPDPSIGDSHTAFHPLLLWATEQLFRLGQQRPIFYIIVLCFFFLSYPMTPACISAEAELFLLLSYHFVRGEILNLYGEEFVPAGPFAEVCILYGVLLLLLNICYEQVKCVLLRQR